METLVKGDKEVKKMLKDLSKASVAAARNAVNSGCKKMRTALSKEVKQFTGMKFGTIRKLISYSGAHKTNLSAFLKISGVPVSAIKSNAHWRKRQPVGATVQYWGEKTLPGAFIMTGNRGGKVVAKRVGKKRFPIEKVWLPSLGEVYSHNPGRLQRHLNKCWKTIQKEYIRLLDVYMNKVPKGGDIK